MSDQKRFSNLIDFTEEAPLLTVEEQVSYLNKWFLTTIAYDQELPITFTRCCNCNIIDKEKTIKALKCLTQVLCWFVLKYPSPSEHNFYKSYLEIALTKEQEKYRDQNSILQRQRKN